MKKCFRCEKIKNLDFFGKDIRHKDNKQSSCKECQRELLKQFRTKKRELVNKAKDKPCMDCGVKYPYYVMDFDHKENKCFGISEAVNKNISLTKIKLEIEKCDLVCANCHRIRTFIRV